MFILYPVYTACDCLPVALVAFLVVCDSYCAACLLLIQCVKLYTFSPGPGPFFFDCKAVSGWLLSVVHMRLGDRRLQVTFKLTLILQLIG